MLRENHLNWFSFVMELKLLLNNYSSEVLNQALIDFAHFLSSSDISEEEDRELNNEGKHYCFLSSKMQRRTLTLIQKVTIRRIMQLLTLKEIF